jgi:two-component sensor histidine kinase
MLLSEAVSNSAKHAFKETKNPIIDIKLELTSSKQIVLIIKDNGIGFIENKTSEKKQTLGLKLMQIFANKLSGKIEIKGENGTIINLTFPYRN